LAGKFKTLLADKEVEQLLMTLPLAGYINKALDQSGHCMTNIV